MSRLTLEQIQALIPNQDSFVSASGLTPFAASDDDGMMRYLDRDGEMVSRSRATEILDPDRLRDFQNRRLAALGVIPMQGNWSTDYADLGQPIYATEQDYLRQLYGGGDQVGDYFVMPENNLEGRFVGTPLVNNRKSTAVQDFLKGALILAGAGYGLNALTAGMAGGGAGAGAGWTSGFDLPMGNMSGWGISNAGAAAPGFSAAASLPEAASPMLGADPLWAAGSFGNAPGAASLPAGAGPTVSAAEAAFGSGSALGGSMGSPGISFLDAAFPKASGLALPTGGASGGSMSGWGDILKGITTGDLVKGGLNLASGILGSNAAGRAADAQSAASANAIAEQRRQFDQTRGDMAPFMRTGIGANRRLAGLMGVDPEQAGNADFNALGRRFTMADRDADPVYQSGLQFGMDEGRRAINARATATGNWDSGATLRALTRFGNDYGSTKANDSFNRFQTEGTNIYNRLAGISGGGQTAANTVASAGANMAGNIGNLETGMGNARAAGIVGGNNSWAGALGGISGIVDSANSRAFLKKILGA